MRTPEETLAALDEIEARAAEVRSWAHPETIEAVLSGNDVPDLVALVRQLVAERDELRRCWDKMAEALPPGPHEAWIAEDHGDIAARAIRALVAERDELHDEKHEQSIRDMNTVGKLARERDEALSALRDVLPLAECGAQLLKQSASAAVIRVEHEQYRSGWHASADLALALVATAKRLLGIEDHERPLSQSNDAADQHVPHPETEEEP